MVLPGPGATMIVVKGTQFLGPLICWLKRSHRPGRLINSFMDARSGKHVMTYACPRCGRLSENTNI